MKKQKEITWEWDKKPTLLNKLGDGQLNHIKELLKTSKRPVWFGSTKLEILNEIKSIEQFRSHKHSKELIDQIIERRIDRARKGIDNLIAKHVLFKNMVKL